MLHLKPPYNILHFINLLPSQKKKKNPNLSSSWPWNYCTYTFGRPCLQVIWFGSHWFGSLFQKLPNRATHLKSPKKRVTHQEHPSPKQRAYAGPHVPEVTNTCKQIIWLNRLHTHIHTRTHVYTHFMRGAHITSHRLKTCQLFVCLVFGQKNSKMWNRHHTAWMSPVIKHEMAHVLTSCWSLAREKGPEPRGARCQPKFSAARSRQPPYSRGWCKPNFWSSPSQGLRMPAPIRPHSSQANFEIVWSKPCEDVVKHVILAQYHPESNAGLRWRF